MTSVIEIYDKDGHVVSTSKVHGKPKVVMQFINDIMTNIYHDCLYQEIDPDDPQLSLL